MKKIVIPIIVLVYCSLLVSCGGKATIKSFMREDVTLDFVSRVCVLPLQNNTDKQYADELARDVINTQILAMDLFDVVDQGIVDSILHEEAIEPGSPISQLMLKRLGQRLNVQAIMVGSVDMAGDKRSGSIVVPEISLTLRLIETKSGLILWQASGHRDGDSMLGRLFGITPADSYKVVLALTRELLSTIPAGPGDMGMVESEPLPIEGTAISAEPQAEGDAQ